MRIPRLTALLLLGAIGSTAQAGGFEGEVGYLHLDTDLSGVSLGSLYGTVGYTWEGNGNYSGTAEFLGAYGVTDDSFLGVNVDLDSLIGVGYRGTFEINHDMSWYYRAVFARVDISASAFGITLSDAESDFGAGVGFTYRQVTVGFLKFFGDLDGGNAIHIGYRF